MMKHYRFTVVTIKKKVERQLPVCENVDIIKVYYPHELFQEWMNSVIRVQLTEQFLRYIAGDTAVLNSIKDIIFKHMWSKQVFRSSEYASVYFEVKEVLKYAANAIVIGADEAKELIEANIKDVTFKKGMLDITVILNEIEVTKVDY